MHNQEAILDIQKISVTQVLKDYLSLMKPGVASLLLVSTYCPMVLASDGHVSFLDALWAVLGGFLVSGSASAINCIWDRDIDIIMERTKNRPLAKGRISPQSAAIFSFFVGLIGLVILAKVFNPLAAVIALLGHLFYVFVYTMWLKRTTPQNIVIGGAAGAVPPLVGWAAMTGQINLTAFLLFLLIFLWTPPHFWALALNKNTDYQKAKIPMLPVIAGESVTHLQMLCYALTLIPVSILLVFSCSQLGAFSMITLVFLGVVFVFKIWQLKDFAINLPSKKVEKTWDVFHFSLIYLTMFFACLVIDTLVV